MGDIPYLLEFGFGGLPWVTKDVFERWSPIEYAEDVVTPLLITHGESDRRVPIPQAEQYYRQEGQDRDTLKHIQQRHQHLLGARVVGGDMTVD